LLRILIIGAMGAAFQNSACGQDVNPVIHIAKLQIDAAQLEKYKAFLKEEISASVKLEPGVLKLFAVADKADPSSITVFEFYASDAAYNSHLETPHFKKYKTGTQKMVKSLELMNAKNIILSEKNHIQF